jgi:hypothetical protein
MPGTAQGHAVALQGQPSHIEGESPVSLERVHGGQHQLLCMEAQRG